MIESSLISLCHAALAAHLKPGNHVLDATCGQGYDTLFLANLVLPGGSVHAVDVQPQALEASQKRLAQAGFHSGLVWHLASHHLLNVTTLPPLAAIVFNLGFLPGSNKAVATRANTTLAALEQLFWRLAPGGLLCVHTYSGHPGAPEEQEAVRAFATALPWHLAQVNACTQMNKKKRQETLFLITASGNHNLP